MTVSDSEASEVTFGSDCFGLSFLVILKSTSFFQARALNAIQHICPL